MLDMISKHGPREVQVKDRLTCLAAVILLLALKFIEQAHDG